MPLPDPDFGDEATRVANRRQQLGLPARDAGGNWALALSGGGIRSATFCFGVLQALAGMRTPPGEPEAPEAPGRAANTGAPRTSLLAQFDYLSTVSGGGYLGAFFVSLFIPGRLRPDSTPQQAAADAYGTLQCEPPGRIRTTVSYAADPGEGAVAWLRENGRYLTPIGAGDAMYAAALALRNWLAMHAVIGSALLVLLSALALGQHLAFRYCYGLGRIQMDLLHEARLAYFLGEPAIWWSLLLWLPAGALLLLAVPPGLAYWMVCPRSGDAQAPARAFGVASVVAVGVGIGMLGLAWMFAALSPPAAPRLHLVTVCACIGVLVLLGVLACGLIAGIGQCSVARYRVRATRLLRSALTITLCLFALSVADTVARTAYLYSHLVAGHWGALWPGTVLGALVWLVRYVATLADGSPGARVPGRAWLSRLPVSFLAGLLAALIALLVYVMWSWAVLWVRWDGREPVDWLVYGQAWVTPSLVALLGVSLLSALLAGQFGAFLNLSTLQAFYAARLTRAYLGASNGARFGAPPAAMPAASALSRFSVAEPEPGDAVALNAYYDPRVLAPVHLINATVSLTVDPAEQLVQRDRKGKPLCLAPGPARPVPAPLSDYAYTRFTIDGQRCRPDDSGRAAELAPARTVGDWIAISGATLSTGLGRATTLGTSLLLGMANLRLGVWWPSTLEDDPAGGVGPRQRNAPRHALVALCEALFRTQYYLGCELTARFHGTRRGWQYLSDGGHFDNTGVYELLRPGRGVGLIVLCDCGCDPDYRFDDLANLIRLVRIDYGLQIEVDTSVCADPDLGDTFGSPEDFAAGGARKCAVLLNVCRGDAAAPVCRIVLLKPALGDWAPEDVREYGAAHPAFPQQSTADQFFDEAQWESYRALGLAVGRRVFGGAGARLLQAV